ncbi:MAG: DUF748 domain-containing protein [Rhodoferax sp.]|uniref:DUF748 domain-containing protein n=1 Tax=Rhodoferax sp. TaxID=50421 RepID=UPI001797E974|nr:DUF748 domain-containing protein [Rhodoferax sp.]NMM15242.1 DUF748 domain-containing protein [Rhodoferax sp.]NMM19727.1 DUF748 domain-containing protein [Rhodoferax sp.]
MVFKFNQQNKWVRRSVWAVGGIVALWGVAWLAVPPIVKSQVEKIASAQLGRKVTLGAVDFKPWSLELTVHDLAVARAAGVADASPQLFIKRFYIDAELQSLGRLAPVLDAIAVDAPHLSLTHLGGGHYDVDDILSRLNKSADKPGAAPLSFALYNLALSGGTMDFTDKAVGKTHELRELQITVPFVSNLASQRTVLVEPKLAFRLNGSRFDSSAQGTPFAQTRKSDASFKLTDLDVTPYLGYLPANLPVKVQSALLNADLKVAFEQSPKLASVKLSGTLQAGKVRVVSAGSSSSASQAARSEDPELLSFDLLKLTLLDVRPLERVARLAALELSGPRLNVRRNKSGQLNLAMLAKPENATENIAGTASGTGAKAVNDAKDSAWKVDLAKLVVRSGAINWTDEGTAPMARLGLRDVTLEASGIALPLMQPAQFGGSANLAPGAGAKTDKPVDAANVRFNGSASAQVANAAVTLADLPLGLAGPYLAQFMTPDLAGTLNADLNVNWNTNPDPAKPAEISLEARQLTLDGVALTQGKTSLASVKTLQVEQALLDLERQRLTLGKLSVMQPKAAVGRGADGRWMYESWLKAEPKTQPKTNSSAASPAQAWAVAIQDVALEGGAVTFVDKSVSKPVAFDLSALSLQLKNFSTTDNKPFAANVSTQIRAGRREAGRVLWRGSAGLSPLAVQGQVDAVRVPVQVFEPYLADALNIDLIRADASFKGKVNYAQTAAGPVLKLGGDARIEDFQANNTAPTAAKRAGLVASGPRQSQSGEELLNWKLLSLRGVNVALAPGTATIVSVKETVWSDFFARLILSEAGRLNLQDVMPSPPQAAASSAGAGASVPAGRAQDATEVIAARAVTTGATPQKGTKPGLAPVISFGPVSFLGGRVYFSDHFIKPNYSTSLTELTGKLSAFSSVTPPGASNLADLELRGRAEGTASLEILGKVNPLVTPVALDIKGRVRDLELPPLSPYSVRYSGYGIERGKLSVDVAYLVLPNGQLTASHNIVLNQLVFGDQVPGAPASLPVKLAVALLADRNGVIDINLPVSGSLNDPQFKLAPIVFKLIINLIGKAITSPFSLLANAFGGGADELSVVSFAPGSAELASEARAGLDKVAKALIERPALKMTVVGTANLEVESDAFKREQLKALVQAEKRRASVVNGSSSSATGKSDGAGGDSVTVTPAEYPALLKAVYRRADFPKPRNLVGLTKDIPVNEMEALLLANLSATDDAMRELAVQRGVTVRDYLAAQKLPLERLFLGAAKAVPTEAKWSPRAELKLTTQ